MVSCLVLKHCVWSSNTFKMTNNCIWWRFGWTKSCLMREKGWDDHFWTFLSSHRPSTLCPLLVFKLEVCALNQQLNSDWRLFPLWCTMYHKLLSLFKSRYIAFLQPSTSLLFAFAGCSTCFNTWIELWRSHGMSVIRDHESFQDKIFHISLLVVLFYTHNRL